jgi:excisionase family DNA binding protein
MNPRTERQTIPALFEGAGSFLPIDTLPWVKCPSFLRGFAWATSMGIFFAGVSVVARSGILWQIVAESDNNVKPEAFLTMATRRQNKADGLLDAEGAAAYMGIHENTLYRLVKVGGLPTVRVTPRNLKFFKSDLIGWLEKRREGTPKRRTK